MYRWTVLYAALLVIAFAALSCSSGGVSPVSPTTTPGITGATTQTGQSQTHLWGYYDCYIDLENMTVEAVDNRSAMFAANVVTFVNKSPANLAFNIKSTPTGTGYVDVDIDVSITHPFPGMAAYNGYDVRGIFIGDGSGSLKYNADLDYGVPDTDQAVIGKPAGTTGYPDGYTRWFNRKEFTTPGIMGYTPGLFASKNFAGNATLCPYKYFADSLTSTKDLFEFLTGTAKNGVFSAGKTNTRNYYLRFPTTKGIQYGYAIVADWIDETTHPANAPEAVACDMEITPNVYYVDSSHNGGSLKLDFSLFSWLQQPDKIFIESNMLTAVHELDASEMIPTGSGDNYATYYVKIPADNVKSTEGNAVWVIAEYSDFDYKNTFGITNAAGSDKMAACFRYDVFVASEPYHLDPLCDLVVVTPMPHNGNGKIEFDITGMTYYDGAVFDSASWDFNGDGTFGDSYDAGTDENPIKYYIEDYVGQVCVNVTDDMGGSSQCCADVDITYNPLWKETFDSDPADWAYANFMWETYCTAPSPPAWTSYGPNGPSGSGNLRYPPVGNAMDGGCLGTVVTPPFDIPSGASEVNLRVYFCEGFGGSWTCYFNSNWKIVESSTPGLSPFISGAPASLPSGGAYLQNTNGHGSTFPVYAANPCYCYSLTPLYGQPGWGAGALGGGAFPGSLTSYFDLVIPSSFYGKTVKVCFQFQPDECGFAGAGTGFAIDDMEVKVY